MCREQYQHTPGEAHGNFQPTPDSVIQPPGQSSWSWRRGAFKVIEASLLGLTATLHQGLAPALTHVCQYCLVQDLAVLQSTKSEAPSVLTVTKVEFSLDSL